MDKNVESEGSRSNSIQFGSKDGMKSNSEVILDFLSIVSKSRKFIAWFVLSATVITSGIALLSPKWYKSTASVFPAEQTSLFPGLQGLSSIASTLGVGPSGTEKETGEMRNLQKSNADSIIEFLSVADDSRSKCVDCERGAKHGAARNSAEEMIAVEIRSDSRWSSFLSPADGDNHTFSHSAGLPIQILFSSLTPYVPCNS